MSTVSQIPVFNLFGETGEFPDVVHCERIRDRALLHDWRISPHRHNEMVQIFHMERGSAKVRVDQHEYQLGDQEFLYVPVEAVHRISFLQGAEGTIVSFPVTLLAALPSPDYALVQRLAAPLKAPADARLVGMISTLVECFGQTGTFRASMLAALGKVILINVAEIAARAEEEQEPLMQRRMGEFERLLRRHISVNWGAAEYAQELGITPGHLNRICRAATGRSASSYIEAARMTEASRLLAFTQLSIADVGYRLGYDDPPYFSRRFRVVTGETPSAYRARFAS